MTNCINCGAPLHGNVCSYCGTQYRDGKVSAHFDSNDLMGEIEIGGQKFQCYIGSIEIEDVSPDCGRDISGKLHRFKPVLKRLFEVIEL